MDRIRVTGIAFSFSLAANVVVGAAPVQPALQNQTPRDVVITVGSEIMEGIADLEQANVVFLTSARRPLRSLEELPERGYKISVYDPETGNLPLSGRLLGNVLRHVQSQKPWQFDVLGPSSYLGIFKEDPPVALVVTYRKHADGLQSGGDAVRIRFQPRK